MLTRRVGTGLQFEVLDRDFGGPEEMGGLGSDQFRFGGGYWMMCLSILMFRCRRGKAKCAYVAVAVESSVAAIGLV
jgi:hypothetical protein